MTKHYKDYIWKNGKPYGCAALLENTPLVGISYKVIADPYYKRISIELYQDGIYQKTIYDSALFDFRHLKPVEQNAWQKQTITESADKMICHIRNQDDRLVLIEEYTFDDNLCVECRSYSPHGNLVAIQKIYYQSKQATFDGVLLYDTNDHLVVSKYYKVNEANGEFSELIEECWDMSQRK